MKRLTFILDSINAFIGKSVSWLSLALVFIIVLDVAMRYIFNYSTPASFELEWHVFAAIFLLGAGWTFRQDRHVRVDVFYQSFSKRNQAIVNLLGALLLLVPFCIIGVVESLPFVISSFQVNETSTDPGGLPARYIIKSTIPIGFFLLGLQGISDAIKSLMKITSQNND